MRPQSPFQNQFSPQIARSPDGVMRGAGHTSQTNCAAAVGGGGGIDEATATMDQIGNVHDDWAAAETKSG